MALEKKCQSKRTTKSQSLLASFLLSMAKAFFVCLNTHEAFLRQKADILCLVIGHETAFSIIYSQLSHLTEVRNFNCSGFSIYRGFFF